MLTLHSRCPASALLLLLCQQLVAVQQVNQVTKLNAEEACPFVGESLRILRQEVRALSDRHSRVYRIVTDTAGFTGCHNQPQHTQQQCRGVRHTQQTQQVLQNAATSRDKRSTSAGGTSGGTRHQHLLASGTHKLSLILAVKTVQYSEASEAQEILTSGTAHHQHLLWPCSS